MKTQFSWATPTGTHGEYADEQLANLQKRIWLIEFLRLGLIIDCQGAMLGLPKLKPPVWVVFIFVKADPIGYALHCVRAPLTQTPVWLNWYTQKICGAGKEI